MSLSIPFWAKASGIYCSHGKGLDERAIAALQSLKVGDRLVIFPNKWNTGENEASLSLKQAKLREDVTQSEEL